MVGEVFKYIYPEDQVPEEKIKELFNKAIENDGHTGIILVNQEDKAKGYIFASLNELYFHKNNIAICLSIWVDEDCRGHSLDMVRALESWARYKGADHLLLSMFEGLTPKGADKIFNRFGFKLKEKQYWKDLV